MREKLADEQRIKNLNQPKILKKDNLERKIA